MSVPAELLVHLRRARDLIEVPPPALLRRDLRSDPAQYLTERRIERSQDLLRATNLTVTEPKPFTGEDFPH